MKRPAGTSPVAWLWQCVNAADARPMDPALKADFLTDLAVLCGLVYDSATIMDVISEETMSESSIVRHFTDRAIEQGIEQSTLQVLELRFGPDAVRGLAARVAAVDDVRRLKQLHREAIRAPSLEAFGSLLDASEGSGPPRTPTRV